MERQTQELKVGKHTLITKTYATGREAQAIQAKYLTATKVTVNAAGPTFNDFDPSVQFAVEEETIRQMVLSLDGSGEDVVNRCLDLPNSEYREIISALDELVAKKN